MVFNIKSFQYSYLIPSGISLRYTFDLDLFDTNTIFYMQFFKYLINDNGSYMLAHSILINK